MPYYQRQRVYTREFSDDGNILKSPLVPHLVEVEWLSEAFRREVKDCHRQLTLRRASELKACFDRKQVGNNKTPFKEIAIVSPERTRTKPVKKLLNAKIEKVQVSSDRFARIMLDAMKVAIVEGWEPDKLHIVQHSSGWDSRMISLALSELKKERDPSWFGDVLFVEVSGESNAFKKIMKVLGWRDYLVYNEGSHPKEHHASCFDFGTAWIKLNGWCGYPMNMNWDPFADLHRDGIIPGSDKVQILTGYGANEIGNWVRYKGGLKPYARFIYYHALSHFPLWGGENHWLHPFYHLGYIRTWIKHSPEKPGNYRQLVVKQLSRRLAKIKPVSKQVKMNRGYRCISDRILEQCVRDYESSWLAQRFPTSGLGPVNLINYHPWWGYWSLASFCEYLRREGYEIKV